MKIPPYLHGPNYTACTTEAPCTNAEPCSTCYSATFDYLAQDDPDFVKVTEEQWLNPPCYEMHCAGAKADHAIGAPECSYASWDLENGLITKETDEPQPAPL